MRNNPPYQMGNYSPPSNRMAFCVWAAVIFTVVCLLVIALSFSGCASTQVQTKIEDPQGQVWTLVSKSDALVEIKRPDGTVVKVDNRGKPTFFETYMQYLLIKAAPSVKLSNQPTED